MANNKYSISDYILGRTDFSTTRTKKTAKFIQDFLKNNIDALMSDGFTKRIVFGNSKNQELLNIYGVDEKEWSIFASKHEVLQWSRNVSNLGNVLLLLHYMNTGDYRIIKFLSIKLFTSRYYKSFPKGIDESRMRATLAKLSKKFFIKKHGSLDKSLDATIKTYLNTYHDRFKQPTDDNVIYLINAIATRIDMFIQNIASKFYENVTDKAYHDQEILDRDSMRTTTNNTLIFESVVSTTISKDMLNGIDRKLVSQLKLDKYLDDLKVMHKRRKLVEALIRGIIYDYINAYPDADIKLAKSNIAKFTIQGRRNSDSTKKVINSLVDSIEDNNTGVYKKGLYDGVLLYYTILLYTNIMKIS